jgi:release factor glutamine methyltransferase
VGTGSGAVPIAIATHAPDVRVLATDVSADALAVARMNAERHGVADRIAFAQADLMAGIQADPVVITANLPYVTREEIDGLAPEIQEHEPRVALDGGADGLDLARRLLEQIADRVATHARAPDAAPAPLAGQDIREPTGMRRGVGTRHVASLRAAFLEIGASQGPAAVSAARAILPEAHVEVLQDLAKLDRVLAVRFP